MRSLARLAVLCGAVGIAAALAMPLPAGAAVPISSVPATTPIEHFIYLMQGDRSFDNYFGTFPGADGLPAGTCQPLVLGRPSSGCVEPYPLHGSAPAPLAASRSIVAAQVDGAKMDGFVAAYQKQGRDGTSAMGYYDERDLPAVWGLARDNVLFDRFFSAVPYGIRLNRTYWVAAAPPPGGTEKVPSGGFAAQPTIFDRLQAAGVSWKFYVENYFAPGASPVSSPDDAVAQSARVPLLNYARFRNDPQLRSHIVDLDEYYRDLEQGTLPQVAYVTSSGADERSARSIPAGQKLVRTMVNQLMMSRYWESSALMISYDGSGGWYDHVAPVQIAGAPSGLRVPAILVSPYAHRGQVNHAQVDYTSALRFIEDNWGLQPLTDRDATAPSLASAFDFASPPRPARLLSAGEAPQVQPAPRTGAIYGFYGSAALIGLLLLASTVAGPRRIVAALRRRWPPRLRTGVSRR